MINYSNKFVLSSHNLVDLLCYPKFSSDEYQSRIVELRSLNIKFVILEGPTVVKSVNILGKGNEGLVLKVCDLANSIMAIKIRRTDSCRITMENEFNFYKYVNLHNIGPKAYLHTKNILLMECMKADQFTKSILDLNANILFSGIIEKSGHLNISSQREALDKHLKGRNAELIISESAYAVDLRKGFSSSFGNLTSICYEYSSLRILIIPVKEHILFLLINKDVDANDLTQHIYGIINSTKELDLYS